MKQGINKKKACVMIVYLLTSVLLCGCSYRARMATSAIGQGNNTYVDVELEPQLISVPVTQKQMETQYMSYLEEQIQTTLETMASVDTAEVSLAQNEAKLAVNVRLTLSESVEKQEDIKAYIEEVISNFFAEEIDLSIGIQ